MADIGNEIDAIRAAKVGEQVRGDIANALEKMNEQAAAAQEWATGEDDPTAEPSATNNAKFYAEKAEESALMLTVDPTLSVSGRAADAKAVGDKIAFIEGGYVAENLNDITFVDKNIKSTDGSLTNSTTRIATETYIPAGDDGNVTIVIPNGKKVYVYTYGSAAIADYTGSYAGGWRTHSDSPLVVAVGVGKYIRFVVAYSNDATISVAGGGADGIEVSRVVYTDTTLTLPNKAADAEVVGYALQQKYGYVALLNNTHDLNSVTEMGAYRWIQSNRPANCPTSEAGGMIVSGTSVTSAAEGKIQIVVSTGGLIWTRYGTLSGYGSFVRAARHDDLQSALYEIDGIYNALGYYVSKTVDDGTAYTGFIDSSGVWDTSSGTTSMREYATDGKWAILHLKATSNGQTWVSFLSSSMAGYAVGDSLPFATGETGRHTIAASTSVTLNVPADCTHVVVQRYYQNSNRFPTRFDVVVSGIENIIASMQETDARLTSAVNGTKLELEPADYSARNGNISGTNKWISSSSQKHSVIPIDGERVISVKAQDNYNAVIAFLTDATVVSGATPAFCTETPGRILIDPGNTYYLLVPTDAKYLYFYRGAASAQNNIPAAITSYSFGMDGDVLRAVIRAAKSYSGGSVGGLTRDIPQNQGMRNAYKKAMQLQDITYTLPAPISSRNQEVATISGIFYSGTADKAHYVGYNVSQRSYMTAMHNQYSGIYTEDVGADDSTSAYGVTYHGSNANIPLGLVCAPFVAWVLGMDIKWENHAWPYLERIGVMEKIPNQSYTGVQLGDMMCYNGHAAIITDIYRNDRGEPRKIYITESTSPVVKTTEYTPTTFMARMAEHYHYEGDRLVAGQILYRYRDLYKNLSYTPSEFVAVDGEPEPDAYVYNEDICPYLGDYSVYNEGDLIAICYTKGSYSNMVIAKNGTVVQTIALPSSADTHHIDLRSYNLTAGSYTAKLTGSGVSDSAPCYFNVISLPISKSESGDNITVTFDKTKDPRYIQVCSISGAARCVIPLTADDITAGTKTFDIAEAIAEQKSTVAAGSANYVIVMYGVTDPAGYKLIRASNFVPLTWTD